MSSSFTETGIPVEIGRIDKELGKLWEASGDTKTRASLINLAVYSEDPHSLGDNTALIANVAGKHACRALLIMANPQAAESRAEAWINAHCHLSGKGTRMVCSEQITFRLDGDAALALPSIVFSHLDSDLPLCFWWQGEFRKTLDEAFWQWIDRLIFDSRHWRDPATQFEIVRQIGTLSDARTVLCDLNWTRLHRTRFAIASLFDHSAALPCLAHIRRLHITHAPGFLTTAHLLTGWLASQLGWRHETLLAESFFVRQDGERVQVQLEEIPGADISVIELATEKSTFRLEREKDAPFFQTLIDTPAQGQCRGIVTAAGENMVDILVAELSRGGRHPLYSKAVATISPLLRGG